MSEAPKDGTHIWVTGGTYDSDGGGSGGNGPYKLDHVAEAYWRGDAWCMGYGEGYNEELWAEPLFWQPHTKPAPPKADKDSTPPAKGSTGQEEGHE